MRKLIKADVRRILSKIGFYVCPAIYLILFFTGLTGKYRDFDEYYFSLEISIKYILGFLVIVPVFMGVYADELKAGAMQIAIGRGLSRGKVVIAKFLDCTIITLILFVFALGLQEFEIFYWNLMPTPLQVVRQMTLMLGAFLRAIGVAAFSAIFVYITWNASVGLIVELLTFFLAEPLLKWIQSVGHFSLYEVSLLGRVDETCANIAANTNWRTPLLFVILYFILFNIISIAIFGRKELEL